MPCSRFDGDSEKVTSGVEIYEAARELIRENEREPDYSERVRGRNERLDKMRTAAGYVVEGLDLALQRIAALDNGRGRLGGLS